MSDPGFAKGSGNMLPPRDSQSDKRDKAHEADLIQEAQVMAVTALRVANLPNLLPQDRPAGFDRRGPDRKGAEKKEPEKKELEKKGPPR